MIRYLCLAACSFFLVACSSQENIGVESESGHVTSVYSSQPYHSGSQKPIRYGRLPARSTEQAESKQVHGFPAGHPLSVGAHAEPNVPVYTHPETDNNHETSDENHY